MRTHLPPGVGNLLVGLLALAVAGLIVSLGTGSAGVAPVVVVLVLGFANLAIWWERRKGER